MLKFIKPYLSRINLIVIIVLLLIHFVIKESNYVFSLLFYTFPLPIIIIAITLLSIFQSKKIRVYNLIIVLVLSVIWVDRSFKINNPESIIDGNIEVVFWNATHKREFHHVFEEFEILPDIVVLVEYHAEGLTVAKAKYPDYFFYWQSESEIGIFSKKPIEIKNVLTSEDETVVINFNTYEMSFYAVDVSASVFVPRQQQLKFVNESIEGNKKTLILGDFNLPFESRFLDNIKVYFNHAFNEKGNGFRETWFWNIPLLSLDHIWVSKDLEILKADKINTFKSDHVMVTATIRN